jgi:tetratricopeptide (TPR) repeat protein
MGTQIVGREPELATLGEFLRYDHRGALLLTGSPGIGKTTLWEGGIELARARGFRVLSARASGAEAQLSFAALIDLFDGVATEELAALPAPQRNALEVALLRSEPARSPAPEHAIAIGFLSALRALTAGEPVLVAIDDIQWLEPASADSLAYAAHRLEDESVGFLIARRPGRPTGLERSLERRGLRYLDVGPLSLGATRRILVERLDLRLPRHALRRIFESTLGNPLFALELGRTLAARGAPAIDEDMPVPDAVEALLGTRVSGLPHPVQRLLLAVALSGDLRVSQLAAITEPTALDDAADAGVLVVDGDRVRPSHPLLAAAARSRSRAADRRVLHRELAGLVDDGELRALHLALATERPNAELAATVAAAASGASARGAVREAVVLGEHALRLTPLGSAERSDRVLGLARYLERAGEKQRMTDLLAAELDSLPPGAARGRACLLLTGGEVKSIDDLERYLERALVESRSDPQLRALVLAEMSTTTAVSRVERIRDAEARALEALEVARHAGPEDERFVLYALSWARSLRGRPIDDLCERFRGLSDAAHLMIASPERVAGQRLVWRGDTSRARAALTRSLSAADERGETVSYALQRLHVCELELRAGEWEEAARLLDEWAESTDRELLVWPMYERCRALLAAGRGLRDEAERWAAEAVSRAEATGVRWDLLEALRALGTVGLLAGEPDTSVEKLRTVWEHTRREGVDDPGAFPVAPDLVEALTEMGERDEADAVTKRLGELAEQQEHPWGSRPPSAAAPSSGWRRRAMTRRRLRCWRKRQLPTTTSAFTSIARDRSSAWAARNGGSGSGARRAARWNRPRTRSTGSALRAGRRKHVRSSPGSVRAGRPGAAC